MKVNMVSRNPDDYVRENKNELHRIPRNYDPNLHSMESAREYVRALNATKLERIFAKPFVANLSGHRDGVTCLGKHPKNLSTLISGSYDGEIRIWDLAKQHNVRSFIAHQGFIRGICYSVHGERFFSISDDNTIKVWKSLYPDEDLEEELVNTILIKSMVTGISHHRKDAKFATCGEFCTIWDENRNDPLKSLKWDMDNLHDVAFNPVENSLLSCCGSDRSIVLYDLREANPVRKMVLTMKSNKLCWNPMEAFNFTVANEDSNLYTFDTRQLSNPLKVHFDHVSAVTDVDYSPTGKEFVSGSYDKTVRIYQTHQSHSREVYHTKRMQHIVCVAWSLDNRYVFTGSEEMNIRMWKAKAAEKLGAIRPRERAAFNYQAALKEKYSSHPQIKRIAKHRQLPKSIMNKQKMARAIKDKELCKQANLHKHSKPGSIPFVPVKRKIVLKEEV